MADSEAIRGAIALVDGGMTQRAASRETGVPLATLQRRLKARAMGQVGQDGSRPDPLERHPKDPNRRADGTFGPGNRANPSGRRAERAEAIRIAEEHAPEAIRVAVQIMRDEKEATGNRLRAIEQILDRALGKPKQAVKLDASLREEHVYTITQKLVRDHPELLDSVFDPPALGGSGLRGIESGLLGR